MVALMTKNATVQSILRAIPRQRRPLSAFTFHVVPPTAEALDLDLYAENLDEAVARATHLAVQAYGVGTTVTLTD